MQKSGDSADIGEPGVGSGVARRKHCDDGRGSRTVWQAEDAALAVKGERIAWIGPRSEAKINAAARNIPVESVTAFG